MNALVEATPISGPANILRDVSEFLHMEELGTLTTEIVFWFNFLQCFNAANVSAVSPD